MIKHLCIGLIGLSSLIGCARQPLPQPPAEPVIIEPNSFMRRWQADLGIGQDKVQNLYVRDNLVLVYTSSHHSYVLDRESGAFQRADRVNRPHDPLFPPLVDAQRIIYPTRTTLEVIDRETSQRRSIALHENVTTPAVMHQDMLFFGIGHAGGDRIMAADISTDYGVKAWEVMTQGDLTAAPALHSGLLYFGANDGHVYGVSVEREAIWPMEASRFNARGPITADVMVDDYAVYATVTNGTVYALDRSNGKIKWQYFASRRLRDGAIPGATQVYLHVPGTGVIAIDKLRGEFTRQAKWAVKEARQVLTEDAERVYLRSADNAILAVDKQSGEIVFRSARKDYAVFSTNMDTPMVYAATSNGSVFAIMPVTKPGQIGHLALVEEQLPPLAAAR